jgi:hypothetical protein
MKKLLLALTLTALSSWSFAAQPALAIQVPYEPSAEVRSGVIGINSWMEVYNVEPETLKNAVDVLVRLRSTPDAAAVVLPEALHLNLNGSEVTLAERSFKVTRGNKKVEYDSACEIVPLPDDKVTLTFYDKKSGATAALNLRVIEQYAFEEVEVFGEVQDLRRVESVTPETCNRVSESRVLLSGVLSVSKTKQLITSIPVLVQAIYLQL